MIPSVARLSLFTASQNLTIAVSHVKHNARQDITNLVKIPVQQNQGWLRWATIAIKNQILWSLAMIQKSWKRSPKIVMKNKSSTKDAMIHVHHQSTPILVKMPVLKSLSNRHRVKSHVKRTKIIVPAHLPVAHHHQIAAFHPLHNHEKFKNVHVLVASPLSFWNIKKIQMCALTIARKIIACKIIRKVQWIATDKTHVRHQQNAPQLAPVIKPAAINPNAARTNQTHRQFIWRKWRAINQHVSHPPHLTMWMFLAYKKPGQIQCRVLAVSPTAKTQWWFILRLRSFVRSNLFFAKNKIFP